jgi:tetratricopeptide (TPR) repeat protein
VNVAVSFAQTARKGLPNLPNTADTLGWECYREGVFDSAIGLFQEAIKGDAKNPTLHFHLGMAYEKKKDSSMAKKEFEETLQISPNYGQADEIRKLLSQQQQ